MSKKTSNKESKRIQNEKAKRKFHKKKSVIILFSVLLLLITAAIILLVVKPFEGKRQILQSKFSIDYTVYYEDPRIEVLEVGIKMNISKLSKEKRIYLLRELADVPDLICVDEYGAMIPYSIFESIVTIGPIEDNVKTVVVAYSVRIGDERDPYGDMPPLKVGCLYEDLLVFTGENVLLTPLIDPIDMMSVEKYIDSVSFNLVNKSGWQAIIPFKANQTDDCSFTVDKPTWGVFNSINKSAFCFGYFEKIETPSFSYYVDKGVGTPVSDAAMNLFSELMIYYGNLFGSRLDKPPVLLRSADINNAVILGGVGADGCAISIGFRNANDCETLSTTIYHAFFDSKVKSPNLRYSSYNWIYRGLADYYVVESAKSMSPSAADDYGIELSPRYSKEMQYLRYLYFSLKEVGFLVLEPSMEATMAKTQYEYYMGTKVPVIITAINDIIKARSGNDDGFLKALVEYGGEEKSLNFESLLNNVCGNDADSVRKFFTGGALVPADGYKYADDLFGQSYIVQELDEYEHGFSGMFYEENLNYPYFQVFLLDEAYLRSEAARHNVHYNNEAVESQVKSFSNTLDLVLLQYAIRCKLSGIDDITVPEQYGIKQKLQEAENIIKWEEFCNY